MLGIIGLTLLIALCASIHIIDKYRTMSVLSYVFKPLTTLLILLYAFCFSAETNMFVVLILLGLMLSLIGDVFLLSTKEKYFTGGLASFLLAHIAYIMAFSLRLTLFHWWVIAVMLLYAVVFYLKLHPKLGSDRIAVAVYIVIIVVMGAVAVNVYLADKSLPSLYMMLGALCFMFSDSVLAWDKFKRKLKQEPSLVMISYYLAQYLIASAAIAFY
ncbi:MULTISPECIES: lysoplasmalogenase [Cysteiniphilum]|uniref:Lysoplasmalogenase n=1 Tax=Cysteiniphilum litorale TaxID=2056700 RepID=A0A8J2Z5D1_9GAMM|nr:MULTISPECIES: lysoplasmalogenase [Cysteiniphilum]GGG00831.1 lysoplasmalogenase [Cysteiniphilum litorale]